MGPTLASDSHVVLAELTAVYQGKEAAVLKNLFRESTFLAFSLAVDLSRSSSERRIRCSQSWLWVGRHGSQGGVLLKQLQEEAKKTDWPSLHASVGHGGNP